MEEIKDFVTMMDTLLRDESVDLNLKRKDLEDLTTGILNIIEQILQNTSIDR
jgi:hypothetical protein